jgi:hypothetical protein
MSYKGALKWDYKSLQISGEQFFFLLTEAL